MFKINYLKYENKKNDSGISHSIDEKKLNQFIKSIPFSLTNDQKKAVEEILEDLKSNSRMNRLLQGDVGSGKTIVSFIAMYANFLSGYQSALMAPTEILAVQHYHNLKNLLQDTNVSLELLTGSTSKKDKQAIYNCTPKSFCTFSRVIKEKGITMAIESIARINNMCDDLNFNNRNEIEIIAKLDIYGPVGEDYKKEFFDLLEKYSKFVEYKGVVNPSDSAKIISQYYCLLFPTLFATEGIPGTIIDSYFAGTPIIASEWNSCYDILNNDCALIYDFQSYEKGLLECIIAFINMEEKIYLRMTDNCFIESKKYEMENVIYQLINEMRMEKEVL